MATLYPEQGAWGEADYLQITRFARRLIECRDGFVEFLPMPSRTHQKLVAAVHRALLAWAQSHPGVDLYFAPLPVRLGDGRFREPDLILRLPGGPNDPDSYVSRPSLVVEVVSETNRNHDLITKRAEYAEAGIPEYWIVDPTTSLITVLTLKPGSSVYDTFGAFGAGSRVSSPILSGLELDVDAVFAAAKPA